jgi:hypothetical protein
MAIIYLTHRVKMDNLNGGLTVWHYADFEPGFGPRRFFVACSLWYSASRRSTSDFGVWMIFATSSRKGSGAVVAGSDSGGVASFIPLVYSRFIDRRRSFSQVSPDGLPIPSGWIFGRFIMATDDSENFMDVSKYKNIFSIKEITGDDSISIETEEIVTACNAFISNWNRVVALMYFTPLYIMQAKNNVELSLQASYNISNRIINNEEIMADKDLAIKVNEEYKRLFKIKVEETRTEDPYGKKALTAAVKFLAHLIGIDSSGPLPIGLKSTFISMILLAWTSFENLAVDLWVASVNLRPSPLARLTGSRRRIAKKSLLKENSIVTQSEDIETKFSLTQLDILTNGTFDASGRMGNLLVDNFLFTKLTEIRTAYSSAFTEKERRARTDNLDSVLANVSFDALSAMRNLFVHKAGKPDEEFEKLARKIQFLPTNKDPDGSIHLDGLVVSNLLVSVRTCCIGLIKAVDGWLDTVKKAQDG